jgi:hypothetical protein
MYFLPADIGLVLSWRCLDLNIPPSIVKYLVPYQYWLSSPEEHFSLAALKFPKMFTDKWVEN